MSLSHNDYTIFSYCLFGDTVNTASRMESTGEGNKIQVTKRTFDMLQVHFPEFKLEPRDGGVEAKVMLRTPYLF